MKIELCPIEKIKPYSGNPRRLPDSAIEKVAQSIKEFGFRQPIVVDKNFVIVAGHTRLKAAEFLELKKVPVHVAKDLSAQKAKAYRLADNRVSEETDWNNELLIDELSDLEGLFTGFDDEETQKLLDPASLIDDIDDFEDVDPDTIPTSYTCPKCGYEWSGKPN